MSFDSRQSSKVLNPISLNASRDRVAELFNDFKRLNIKNHSNTDLIASSNSQCSSSNGDSSVVSSTTLELKLKSAAKPNHDKLTQAEYVALYIGDLDKRVTEELLYSHFKKYPGLVSVKICYNQESKSLGYGYVNFSNGKDANTAIEQLNFTQLLGKEIRMMLSLKGKEKTFLGTNVFLSNLNIQDLTLRSLYEKFKHFGKILSCKLNKEKKYAFISFEDKLIAEKFVRSYNKQIVDGNEIFCAIHIPKLLRTSPIQNQIQESNESYSTLNSGAKRDASEGIVRSTSEATLSTVKYSPSLADSMASRFYKDQKTEKSNENNNEFVQVYIKGLPLDVSENEILNLFSQSGKINHIFKQPVEEFRSSWSVVTFADHNGARESIKSFDKTLYKAKKLTVTQALKKADRLSNTLSSKRLSSSVSTSDILEPVKGNLINSTVKSTYISKDNPILSHSHKLYLYNLPPNCNSKFFKEFLKYYKLEGKILNIQVNGSHSIPLEGKTNNYIEFENRIDAEVVEKKLKGVDICGYPIQAGFLESINHNNEDHDMQNCMSIKQNSGYIGNLGRCASNLKSDCHPIKSILQNNSLPVVPVKYPSKPQASSLTLTSDSRDIKISSMTNRIGLSPHIPTAIGDSRSFPSGYYATHSSLHEDCGMANSQFNIQPGEKIISRLERLALRSIDFLKYPSATRVKNLRRILQYLIDNYWNNDASKVLHFLDTLERDPSHEMIFKKNLADTIELFGFGR